MATKIYLGNPPENIVKWIKENHKPQVNYLCFTAEEAGSTIKMMKVEDLAPTVYLETSTTGKEGSWSEFFVDQTTITLPNVGDKVYFRAKQDNERFGIEEHRYRNYFKMTGKIAASGNINTLLKADGSVLDLTGRDYCYSGMFQDCTSLTQAPELPATTLAEKCYNQLFSGCTSLTQAPELPATTLATHCYAYMFAVCTALTKAPALPATTLINDCYNGMFYNCTSLTQVPCIAKINDVSYEMFYNAENLEEITFTHMTTYEVVAIAKVACIGIPKGTVVCYCTDGVVIVSPNDDSSGSGS